MVSESESDEDSSSTRHAYSVETKRSVDSEKQRSVEKHEAASVTHHEEPSFLPLSGPIGHVLSKTISHRSVDPGPPPDGGFHAWLQAFMGHLVVFNAWGYVGSFGVFQSYHVSNLHRPPSDISWIGSVQIFLLFFIGAFSGRLTDYGLFRLLFAVGIFFFLLGVFMTSLCTTYLQLFLAQGVCTGVGTGLLFCPCVAVVATYFSRRRALALAIAATGTATGGMVFPAIARQLLPKIGFAWTVRVIGFVMLGTMAVAFAFMRPRLPPRKSGPWIEWQAFKELPYTFFTIGMFLVFWGLYFAFYYLPSFGRNILHVSYTQSINDLLILNGVGIPGRLVPAYLSDRYLGPLNTMIPVIVGAAILLYCWAAVDSNQGLTAFSVVYGLFAAAIQGLFPATLTSLTTDLKKTGVRMGMIFSIVSLASLSGPPIAGALVQAHGGGYLYAQLFAGTSLLVGGTILAAARVARQGFRLGRV